MTAGLPGLGLGGVFFIISALLAPFGELIRTARGRSSRARWASVGRQFLMALAVISAVVALLELVGLVSGVGPVHGLSSFSLLPVAGAVALLAFVLVTAKLVQLCSRAARRRRRVKFERRLQPLTETSAASLALLAASLIALALGVWGGFESLPGLSSSHSTRPSEASSRTQNPVASAPAQSHPQSHQSTRAVRFASPSPAGSGSGSASGTSRGSPTASGTGGGTGGGSGGGGSSGTTNSQGSNPKPTVPQPVQSPSTPSAPPATSQVQGTIPTTEAPPASSTNEASGSQLP